LFVRQVGVFLPEVLKVSDVVVFNNVGDDQFESLKEIKVGIVPIKELFQ
jgi:hypothetical protein